MEQAEIDVRAYNALQNHVRYLTAMTVIDWAYETGMISDRERTRLANRMEQRYNVCLEA